MASTKQISKLTNYINGRLKPATNPLCLTHPDVLKQIADSLVEFRSSNVIRPSEASLATYEGDVPPDFLLGSFNDSMKRILSKIAGRDCVVRCSQGSTRGNCDDGGRWKAFCMRGSILVQETVFTELSLLPRTNLVNA